MWVCIKVSEQNPKQISFDDSSIDESLIVISFLTGDVKSFCKIILLKSCATHTATILHNIKVSNMYGFNKPSVFKQIQQNSF